MELESFKKIIDDAINSGELDKYFEFIEYQDKIDNKYSEKFHNFSKEKRFEIINAIINKYDSDKYKDREYSKGRIPDETLYYNLLHYARKYGNQIESEIKIFNSESYVIDDNIKITCVYGQGSKIIIEFMK